MHCICFRLELSHGSDSTASTCGNAHSRKALFTGPRLLTLGANLYERSHPESERKALENFTRSTHAEHRALLKWQHYDMRNRLTLFVARRRSDGTIGNSRPCKNCMKLCKALGVGRVWFFENGIPEEVTP